MASKRPSFQAETLEVLSLYVPVKTTVQRY
jgi:hypothetical protein